MLLGFGATQFTIWDYRSGDVLMNFDLQIKMGRNLGSIFYPILEEEQDNMILLFQYVQDEEERALSGVQAQLKASNGELLIIACNISDSEPSYRILQRHQMPAPAFSSIKSAINTGEHLLITADNDEELWISCVDPNMMTWVPAQHTTRFYAKGRSQLVELTTNTLTVDTFANHILKLAAGACVN